MILHTLIKCSNRITDNHNLEEKNIMSKAFAGDIDINRITLIYEK